MSELLKAKSVFDHLRDANDAMIAAMPLVTAEQFRKLQLAMAIVCEIAREVRDDGETA